MILFIGDLYSEDKFYSPSNWGHTEIIFMYEDVDFARYLIDEYEFEEPEGLPLWAIYDILYASLDVSYHLDRKGFSEEEIQILKEYKPTLEGFLKKELGITEEEAREIVGDEKNASKYWALMNENMKYVESFSFVLDDINEQFGLEIQWGMRVWHGCLGRLW